MLIEKNGFVIINRKINVKKGGAIIMPKHKGGKVAAVIDIGSSDVKMQISQVRNKEIIPLNTLEYPLKLGHEVFNYGKISFECLRELSQILTGYSNVMKEYGVDQYKVVGTTALREAQNKEFIQDQLLIQNNMIVDIYDDNQEKSLIYSAITKALNDMDNASSQANEKSQLKQPENMLLSYIGTGSIGISLYNGKHIFFTQNISTGSLKLHDVLSGVQEYTDGVAVVVDEYLDSIFSRIQMPVPYQQVNGLVLTGNEMQRIAKLCDADPVEGNYIIKSKTLTNLYQAIRLMPLEKIALKFSLTEEVAEMFYSSLAIYAKLLKFTEADYVVAPKVDLWDTLIEQMLIQKRAQNEVAETREHALACAKTVAERYRCNCEHANFLMNTVCTIFDKIKRLHGLNPDYKLLLEIASILHDCGYFINSKHHLNSNVDVIKYTDIYGLTEKSTLMAAYISRFAENETPNYNDAEFSSLKGSEKIIALKLAAIFRLANSLDKSQKQKLQSVKVRLEEDKLMITAKSNDNTRLEHWAFEKCSAFFKEVFGVQPILTVKSNLI